MHCHLQTQIPVPVYGRDANSILREVMNVSERPAEIKQRMDLFYAYMDENNYNMHTSISALSTSVPGYLLIRS